MSDHTPGPWSADYGDFSAYCETGAEVCRVTKGNHDDGASIPEAEMEANLRLVAAATEILAALKELVAYDDGSSEPEDYGYEVLQRCKTAIAKAEGKGGR